MYRRDWLTGIGASCVAAPFGGALSPPHVQAQEPDLSMVRTRAGGQRFSVVARAPAGIQPKSVRVSPDGRVVYVCNFGRTQYSTVNNLIFYSLKSKYTKNFGSCL